MQPEPDLRHVDGVLLYGTPAHGFDFLNEQLRRRLDAKKAEIDDVALLLRMDPPLGVSIDTGEAFRVALRLVLRYGVTADELRRARELERRPFRFVTTVV